MYRRNIRYLFKKLNRSLTTNNSSTVNNSITIDKPLGTGSGPFIELPRFKTLGKDGNLLQVIIPQSSSNLNIQINSNSIIGVTSNDGIDLNFQNKFLPIDNGLEFQELSTTNTNNELNLLIHGNNNNNYKLIELTKKQIKPWILIKDENLIGWIENYKLEFQSIDILQNFKSLQIKGNGYILINGTNEGVIDLNLGKNEEILINPNSLIAINGNNNDISYQLIPHIGLLDNKFPKISLIPSKFAFKLPTHGIWGNLFNPIKKFIKDNQDNYNKLVKTTKQQLSLNQYINLIGNYIIKIYEFIYSKLFYNSEGFLLRRNPIFIKIKGPARIIMNNNHVINNNKIFTIKEIKSIL